MFFHEELHALEAVIAGQGVSVCSDVLVERELRSGALVKLFDVKLPGLGFYFTYTADHPRVAVIKEFQAWAMAEASR